MTFHPGQLVRCVKHGPWRGKAGDIGPRYDDRLTVLDVSVHPTKGYEGLELSGWNGRYFMSKFFRPVTFTKTEAKITERA